MTIFQFYMSHRFSSKTYAYYKIRVRENKMSNQEWTIQRHWQHLVHNAQNKDKQSNTQHRKLKRLATRTPTKRL